MSGTSHPQHPKIRQILRRSSVQPKLTIGAPNDKYEQEADRVADQVMRMRDSSGIEPTSSDPQIQRLCEGCEEEVRRQPLEEEEELLQPKRISPNEGSVLGPETQSRIAAVRQGGETLPANTRSFFEPRFGQDFSGVRVHTDAAAADSASSVNAQAYTLGRDIVFGSGQYAPETSSGKQLLAHELTHVVQQGEASPAIQPKAISRLPRDGRGEGEDIDGRIQCLKVTRNSLKTGTCGARKVQWTFTLGTAAPEDGYIVQQVDRYGQNLGCPPIQGVPAPRPPFWEAWFVNKGNTNEHKHGSFGFTDQHNRPPSPGTSKFDGADGTIKFFKTSVTGDLGKDGVPPSGKKNKDWGPGKVPASGALPSTSKKPTWWGKSHEGPASRSASAGWDCCDVDPKKHTNNINVSP